MESSAKPSITLILLLISFWFLALAEMPRPPTDLKVSHIGTRELVITWKHGKHNSTVAYTIIKYMEYKHSPIIRKQFGDNSSYTISGLKPYKDYVLSVSTCFDNSLVSDFCSGESEKIEKKTSIDVPSAPQIVELLNTNGDKVAVIVRWFPPLDLNGPPPSYKILYQKKGGEDWIPINVLDNAFSRKRFSRSLRYPKEYTLTDLMPSSVYNIKVSAGNKAGLNHSDVCNILTDESAPEKPQNLTLIMATAKSLKIRWLPPRAKTSYSKTRIACYHVSAVSPVRQIASKVCQSPVNELLLSSLEANTTYNVILQASVRRNRDNKTLLGPSIEKEFATKTRQIVPDIHPAVVNRAGNSALILVTVICILVVIVVILAGLLYCKKKNLFDKYGRSVFYIEEPSNQQSSSVLRMHSSERKLTITTEEFQEHVARLHADSNYLFSEEFYSLGPSKPDCTWEHSTLHINKSKNRYQDVVAYDHSRVRLMSIDGVPASNYINANFVDGFEKKHAYIATQAPLNQTIEDFWRMVWEQDARLLVMLTNLMERGRRKCDQYWPHNGEVSYGDITVRKLEERKYAFYVHRVFSVTCSSAEICKALGQDRERVRVVRQFHFTDWPDFGVPQERSAMLSFVHLVRRYMQENEGPTVIHCSAGVGRTGTFIVIESQIERINREQSINVYGFLKDIRSQRNFLVQQEVQYIFIHDALMDYIKCGLTAIPVSELVTIHNDYYFDPHPDTAVSVIEEEWLIINEFNIHEFEMLTGRRPCNQQKNRDSFIIPVDATRVRLTMKSVTEGTDYVNANYVDSYLQKKAFIVTQMPLHDTIEDFWRMIWENFSQIVVSLLSDEECNKEDFFSYLPRPDCNPVNFGAFEIRCLSEKKLEFYRLRELEVVGRVEGGESERRKVHHYQFLSWQENTLPEIENAFEMISLIKDKKTMERGTGSASSSPVVVHCSCGIGRSGVFCALSNIKEQMDDFEETIDVFSTVRMLRRQRPLLINSKDSYEYLYRAALRYKEMMPAFPPEEEFQDLHIELTHSPAPFSEDVLKLIENMEEDSDSDVGI